MTTTDPKFDAWMDEQMGRLRAAVTPTFKALYAEREANRAKIAELAQDNTDLEVALQACRDEKPPEPPPPAPVYDATRLQVLWLPFNTTLQDWIQRVGNGERIYAAVVMADLKNKGGDWIHISPMLRSKGIKVYAYVRAPVHVRIGKPNVYSEGISTGAPFEHHVYNLVKAKDAWVRDTAGHVMYHSGGYDAYITPWLLAAEHAALVREYAWDPAYYDGLLVDGLVTNQIYAQPAAAADYDRDGKADVEEVGWNDVSFKQGLALIHWANALAGIPLVGNGSWEPVGIDMLAPSWRIAGAYDEDQTHPIYVNGDNNQQTPSLSGRWAMHQVCARQWVSRGLEYWMGGNYRLFNLPREQGLKFLIASALITGARVVANEQHSWWGRCGKALGEAVQQSGGMWVREFEGGKVLCDPLAKTGAIL